MKKCKHSPDDRLTSIGFTSASMWCIACGAINITGGKKKKDWRSPNLALAIYYTFKLPDG